MGLIRVPITLEGKKGKASVTASVDTGASITIVPRLIAEKLGLTSFKSMTVQLADGQVKKMPVSMAIVNRRHRSVPSSVFIVPTGEVLLGAETLELLDVTVDPKRRRLKMGKHFALKAA